MIHAFQYAKFDISSISPMKKMPVALVFDLSAANIVKFADEHPGVFVFPFFTSEDVREVPDCSLIHDDHICQPTYIGNIHNQHGAALQIVELFSGLHFDQMERIAA